MLVKDSPLKLFLPLLFLILIFLSGCGKCNSADKKGIAAYVNKEPIYESELKRAIAMKVRQNPIFKLTPQAEKDELETLIDKKLIIQQAIDKGMVREARFVNTIKNFWEQTLIRDFIDYKRKEFQDYLFVTEDEVKKYYDNLSEKAALGTLDALKPEIEKRIADEKESKLFDEWLRSERKKARIEIINPSASLRVNAEQGRSIKK